ncbi:hypothetical protein TPHA_0H00850 [Tetrapisispora phaffii CBS 4417]|uniref:Uncharacterized protein n=1 Tax=Tetrapisispora phaffii (strain ATCC 24235 / CBS 4417 / NBRC 1672 / NRRL Y-8282 / UCD 70-5) TaxID=1071381 RepID=G8BWY9_TETPH|nr:hypothetical protein TPHA_0H00850 [Tetrapisispora phaffii CBS 4417]CCE64293.1 hypothetical protein TPHA_0H00850 [Tetrapisispora phaffii CBS 4417]
MVRDAKGKEKCKTEPEKGNGFSNLKAGKMKRRNPKQKMLEKNCSSNTENTKKNGRTEKNPTKQKDASNMVDVTTQTLQLYQLQLDNTFGLHNISDHYKVSSSAHEPLEINEKQFSIKSSSSLCSIGDSEPTSKIFEDSNIAHDGLNGFESSLSTDEDPEMDGGDNDINLILVDIDKLIQKMTITANKLLPVMPADDKSCRWKKVPSCCFGLD